MSKKPVTNIAMDLEMIHESEGAYLLKFPGDDDSMAKWIPKSLVRGKLVVGLNQACEIQEWKAQALDWA